MLDAKVEEDVRDLWNTELFIVESTLVDCLPDEEKRELADLVYDELLNEGRSVPRGKQDERIWGEDYAKRLRAKLLNRFQTYLEENKENLRKSICESFEYCRKRKEGKFSGDRWNVCIGLVDFMLVNSIGAPFPITVLCVYLVRNEFLDTLCECP